MNNKLNKVIIAAGGTGGHIFPGYSLAKHFNDQKINVELISDKRGLKYLKNYNDIRTIQINSATVFKKNIFKLIFSILINLYSLFRSLILLASRRPELVIGMGGYSSFPICIAAKILRIPFIIYENNLHIGKSNKYLLPFAKKIFVSNRNLEGISKNYRNKLCEVGNIVRKEVFDIPLKYNSDNRDEKIKLLILGGSQAAKIFAEKLPQIFKECHEAKIPLEIWQQCLPNQNELLTNFYKKLNINFKIFNFNNNIFEYFSNINLAITRSGSSMLAELVNAKKPFISVPLPSSADNHQLKNAIYYEKNEYSYLIEEKNLSKKLFQLIKLIHNDRSLLNKLINNQKKCSDKLVYENIDKEIIKIINEEY